MGNRTVTQRRRPGSLAHQHRRTARPSRTGSVNQAAAFRRGGRPSVRRRALWRRTDGPGGPSRRGTAVAGPLTFYLRRHHRDCGLSTVTGSAAYELTVGSLSGEGSRSLRLACSGRCSRSATPACRRCTSRSRSSRTICALLWSSGAGPAADHGRTRLVLWTVPGPAASFIGRGARTSVPTASDLRCTGGCAGARIPAAGRAVTGRLTTTAAGVGSRTPNLRNSLTFQGLWTCPSAGYRPVSTGRAPVTGTPRTTPVSDRGRGRARPWPTGISTAS
ncbi:hypothetical protein KAURM247S_05996 [Kitasatospora aureofaciens]